MSILLVKHEYTQNKNWILFNCQIINCVIKIVKKGGGVTIYIANCIDFQIHDNLSCTVKYFLECISVELHIANSKPIIVSCIHRQRDSKISQSIDIIENVSKKCRISSIFMWRISCQSVELSSSQWYYRFYRFLC